MGDAAGSCGDRLRSRGPLALEAAGAGMRTGNTATLEGESAGSTLRVSGDTLYASPPSLSVAEMDAKRATAG